MRSQQDPFQQDPFQQDPFQPNPPSPGPNPINTSSPWTPFDFQQIPLGQIPFFGQNPFQPESSHPLTDVKPRTGIKKQGKELLDTLKRPGLIRAGLALLLSVLIYNGTAYQRLGVAIAWLGLAFLVLDFWKARKSRWPKASAVLPWVGMMLIYGVLIALFWQSAHIYTSMALAIFPDQPILQVGNLGADIVEGMPVVGWLIGGPLRLMAAMLRSLELTAIGTVAVLLYGYIQYSEVAPILLKSNIRLMDQVIDAMESQRYLSLNGNESNSVKELIEERNDYYDSYWEDLKKRQFWSYITDGIICAIYAPIFIGGYTSLVFTAIRFTFGFGLLDWANIFRIFISMFGFAFVVKRYVKIRREYLLVSGKLKG